MLLDEPKIKNSDYLMYFVRFHVIFFQDDFLRSFESIVCYISRSLSCSPTNEYKMSYVGLYYVGGLKCMHDREKKGRVIHCIPFVY